MMKTSKYIKNILLTIGLILGLTAFAVGKPWDHGNLKVSSDKRMLQHKDGTGFFWMGDTAWHMTRKLNNANIDKYLTDRKNKKYTVIQTVAVADKWGQLDTRERPFEDMVRYRKPNEKYWKRVDYIVNTAEEKGLYVALLPMWNGKIAEISNADIVVYAKWIANRYKNKPNIIWVVGGDSKIEISKWRAMGKTINAIDSNHLITFHPTGGKSSSEWFHNESWLDFNMIQSGHSTKGTSSAINLLKGTYKKNLVKPVLDAEPRYEDIHVGMKNGNPRFTDFHTREIAYKQLFSGAFGHTYGHQSIWQMWSKGDRPCITGGSCRKSWEEALNDSGAKQMQYISELMQSKPIIGRVPDQSIINSGNGVATRGNGYAFVYISSGKLFTINMNKTKISGETVKASWYNPRNGKTTKDSHSPYGNTGTQEFTPPTLEDWVLILDDGKKTKNKDRLTSIKGPSILTIGKEVTVEVDYATADKDLFFSLQQRDSPWTNYYSKVVSSDEDGSKITFTVPSNIPADTLLIYQTYLTPKSKAWEDKIVTKHQKGISIEE